MIVGTASFGILVIWVQVAVLLPADSDAGEGTELQCCQL